MKSKADFGEDDFRRELPRFQGDNFGENLEIVRKREELAQQRGVRPVQRAVAWVLAQGKGIVPIPGTTRVEHLDELVASTTIQLSPADVGAIGKVFPLESAAGERYYAAMRPYIGR